MTFKVYKQGKGWKKLYRKQIEDETKLLILCILTQQCYFILSFSIETVAWKKTRFSSFKIQIFKELRRKSFRNWKNDHDKVKPKMKFPKIFEYVIIFRRICNIQEKLFIQ